MKKDCERFHALITGYIDGELNSDEKKEVETLLKESSEFYEYYLSEMKLKELLQKRLPIVRAPFYLKGRIQRQIARNGNRPGFWQLVYSLFEYRPIATSFAFAVLAFLILIPTYQMIESNSNIFSGRNNSSGYSAKAAQLKGEIICLDCEVFSQHNKAFVEHDPVIHRPGLRAEDGSIWTILQSNAGKEIQYTRKLLKKKASLSGVVFENSRYIRVDEYKLL